MFKHKALRQLIESLHTTVNMSGHFWLKIMGPKILQNVQVSFLSKVQDFDGTFENLIGSFISI